MRVSRPLTALAALVLVTGGCSNGTDDAADQPEADSDRPAPVDPQDPASADADVSATRSCSPERPADPGTQRLSFDDDGTQRSYDLTVPPGYDGRTAAPLLLDMHGFSSNASQQAALSGMPEAAGERGYVVVTPQALRIDVPLTTGTINTTFWNIDPAAVREGFEPVDDLGFLDALLDEVGSALCIDGSREFATGMSNGAGMTMALVCGEDTRFAAAAPVAGAGMVGDCRPGQSIPLIAFHGDADPLIPYEGGQVVGQDYEVVGVEERVASLAEAAGCDSEPEIEQPFDDITTRLWHDCVTETGTDTHTGADGGWEIVLVTVLGGGHMWPGADLSAFDASDAPEGQAEFIEGFDFAGVAGNPTESIDATSEILDFFDSVADESTGSQE